MDIKIYNIYKCSNNSYEYSCKIYNCFKNWIRINEWNFYECISSWNSRCWNSFRGRSICMA